MYITAKITMETSRIIFGEGIMEIEGGDELGFQFSSYKEDGYLRVSTENGKVGVDKLLEVNQRARACAKETVAAYAGVAA